MIVIATNNGNEYLPKLLTSIELHGTENHKICIVDTGSTDEAFLIYLNNLDSAKYIITHTPYKGYDTGAYIHAYRNFIDDEYIFMHDSIEILTNDWISCFKQNDPDVCYYSAFDICYDNDEQLNHLMDIGIHNPDTVKGVFGPIFYIKTHILDLISQTYNLSDILPKNKMEQMGMERGWAMMIDSVTSNRTYLSDFFEWWNRSNNGEENPATMFKTLTKYRPKRDYK
jgi:glycosyltransferase involved in cell wall biosynthesis